MQRGFTLLEILVASAIFLMLFIAVADLTESVLGSYQLAKNERALTDNGALSLERISRQARDATSVEASSTLNAAPGDLLLATGTTSPAEVEFYLLNGAIQVNDDGVDVGPLTSSDVTASNLLFLATTTSESSAIEFSFTLTAGTSTTAASANFYDTVVVRGSY